MVTSFWWAAVVSDTSTFTRITPNGQPVRELTKQLIGVAALGLHRFVIPRLEVGCERLAYNKRRDGFER
jgi:hypothetical protein